MKIKNKDKTMPAARIIFMAAIITFLCFNPFLKVAYALNGADVALYNDSIAPAGYEGAWQSGVTAIKNMLTTIGLTYEEITYMDLNYSTQDFSGLYKVILIPGGYAQWYNYWISKAGKERIRNFVRNGGGYFGICAGSFFALDRTVWEGTTYDDNEGYNAYGELTGYDLDLFPGSGTGPMNEIANWNAEGYNMTTINFQTENTVLTSYKTIPYAEDILYYGGPYFSADAGSAVEVLATYNYNGQPAVVAFNYGSGRVVLSGPHPEIEEDSDRDGVTIDREDIMNDNGSDWELVKYILNWIMNRSISHAITPPSNTTVSRGSLLGPFSASATNTSSSSYSSYVYLYIGTPDGNWISISPSRLITLAAGETSSTGNLYIRVPSIAQAGTAYYWVNIYDTSYNLIDQDYFSFAVTAGASALVDKKDDRGVAIFPEGVN